MSDTRCPHVMCVSLPPSLPPPRYWDSQSGNCVSLEDPDSAVRCIHMDLSSGQLVAGTEFGRLLLWDTRELDGEEQGMVLC